MDSRATSVSPYFSRLDRPSFRNSDVRAALRRDVCVMQTHSDVWGSHLSFGACALAQLAFVRA